MRVFPEDHGARWHVALARKRTAGGAPLPSGPSAAAALSELPDPRIGWLGRLWSLGSRLSRRQLARVLPALGAVPQVLTWALGGTGLGLAALGLVAGLGEGNEGALGVLLSFGSMFAAAGMIGPMFVFRAATLRPVSDGELEFLLAFGRDDLDREFLFLARQALRVETDAATEAQIRACIAELGEAIDRLPASDPIPANVTDLLNQARELRESASAEGDALVASSLLRQAKAHERADEASERAHVLARRARFLRDELHAQAHALRLGVTAFASGEEGDMVGLCRLAESARDVAREVDAVVAARSEISSHELSLAAAEPDIENLLARLRRS